MSGSPIRARSLTSIARSTQRASAIVDEVFASTAQRNEWRLARGRVFICGAFLARQLALYGDDVLEGHPLDVLPTLALAFAMLVSGLHLLRPNWRLGRLSQRLVSVSLDVFVYGVALLAAAWWPDPLYRGVFSSPVLACGGLVAAGAGLRLDRRYVVITTIGIFAVYGAGLLIDLARNATIIDWTFNRVLFWVILFAASGYLGDVVAARTRSIAIDAANKAFDAERARERFGAYVGTEVAALALSTRDVVLGGRRQPVAILFCDLRGFTTASEAQAPEEVVRQLNAWFEVMVAAITAHGGVVDKYVGDAIMAVFGAPHGRPDDARRAVLAALAMRRSMEAHNMTRRLEGLPSLQVGIGVHHGEVIAGNIGTASHAQYTVIGDAVNLASRLESVTREHGVDTFFSRDVVEAARHVPGDPLPVGSFGTIKVRGRGGDVEVFVPTPPVGAPMSATG
jgi:class 3 adenylate cyclase